MTPKPGETALNQMKRSKWDEVSVTITALGQIVIPYLENRVSLLIGCHPTVSPALSRSADPTSTSGVILPAAGSPLPITIGNQGSMVKGPIFAKSGVVPYTLTYWEASNNEI